MLGLSNSSVLSVMKRHSNEKALAQEGGRTSRGSIKNMRTHVGLLNEYHNQRANTQERDATGIAIIEEFWRVHPTRFGRTGCRRWKADALLAANAAWKTAADAKSSIGGIAAPQPIDQETRDAAGSPKVLEPRAAKDMEFEVLSARSAKVRRHGRAAPCQTAKRMKIPIAAIVTRTPPIHMPICHRKRMVSRCAASASRFAISVRSLSKAVSFFDISARNLSIAAWNLSKALSYFA